ENDTNLVKVLEGRYSDKAKKREDLSKFGTVGGFSGVFNDGVGAIEYKPEVIDAAIVGGGNG
ncbi:MAG: hypothetical protein GXO16_08835, partial [Epsilonproteobacteria bacterium]|nr:hypothetical protein [Campylobacterota bacterium]